MIQDIDGWRAWEDDYIRSQPTDYVQNLRIFEALYQHARRLGAFPPEHPLDGIETKIRMARILNGLSPP